MYIVLHNPTPGPSPLKRKGEGRILLIWDFGFTIWDLFSISTVNYQLSVINCFLIGFPPGARGNDKTGFDF